MVGMVCDGWRLCCRLCKIVRDHAKCCRIVRYSSGMCAMVSNGVGWYRIVLDGVGSSVTVQNVGWRGMVGDGA